MSKTTILDNDQITLWYHPEKKIIHHQMHKYVFGPKFREFLLKGVDVMRQRGADKWLSDDRLNPVLKPEDNQWAMTEWAPMVMKAGWKYWAIVQPEHLIAKLRMETNAKAFADMGLTVQLFSDPDEALKWLESV